MARTDSIDLEVDVAVPDTAIVGEPNFYLARPGFWVGGIGIAAVWLGAARRVLAPLAARAAAVDARDLLLAHYGAAWTRVVGSTALLDHAALVVDRSPATDHRDLALMARYTVERAVTEIVERVGLALGAGPLCLDADHARLVADLTVFVRQTHGDGDMCRLARGLLSEGSRS
jgi:alkylation response protein AidB-like acyl-CoA dehydrogenase